METSAVNYTKIKKEKCDPKKCLDDCHKKAIEKSTTKPLKFTHKVIFGESPKGKKKKKSKKK